MARRLLILLTLALAVAGLGACGNKEEIVLRGETEGAYLDVGDPPLKYQVQISRQLNPQDTEDRDYFVGLPDDEAELKGEEVWFAVFMRVQNDRDQRAQAADEFTIEDTQGNEYEPIELSDDNVFAYRPRPLEPKALLPAPDSAAFENTIGGALLLYKIPRGSLENRPLELIIKSPTAPDRPGTVDLDI